ncbi:16S rRNA (uracil(1498)-N(3))-methyltransferase [Cellulomonas soli]|uniref:16S rRNA (uracil(1498)-N(3))-methyltransferase n=1 Tax=Cellulomonas soli TaxID=931535 RepID=UPI003F8298B6
MSAPVFLAEPGTLGGVLAGALYLLDGAEGRHAGVVQRRGAGEHLDVVDGAGVRLRTVVETVDQHGLQLRVLERVEEPAPAVSLVLVQALAKGDRDELAIEAATEVGADGVLPWQADRSIVVWRGDRAAKSRARWLATVRSAAKQSRRACVPEVGLAVDTAGLVARVAACVAAGGVALVLHEEATTPIARAALPEGSPDGPAECLVVVGPEGGITERETALLTQAGAQAVRLGPHVLRTSTAGPVALALLAERLGRWA